MAGLGVGLSVLSALVLGAHVWRWGSLVLGVVVAASPLLLLVRAAWPVRVMQALLALGALEWVRTTVRLVQERQEIGRPYARMVAILGAVALVSALAALLLQALAARRRPAA